MQAIVETLFDTVYLISVITIGILMIRKSKGNRQFTMFGMMAVLLGSGDAFHLIPRATALCTTGLENFTVQLGLGKWITSITMTIFYVVLYHVWRERYQIKDRKATTAIIYGLAVLRIVLCMMPQNKWLTADAPLSWGIYRNIPFALMGLIIIVLFYKSAKENHDTSFRLRKFLEPLQGIEKIEILPYHAMGVHKWEALGIPYSLKDVNPPTAEEVEKAKKY